MTKLKMLGAALILSAAIATPAFAEVISEPGNFAFFYPNGDLRLGYSMPQNAMAGMRGADVKAVRMPMKTNRAHRMHASKPY
jgi:hypothetical protein